MAFIDDIKGLIGGASRLSLGEEGGDPIVLDASVLETHAIDGEVSDHPVETGTDIVDNYRVLPRKLEVEGVISNSPLTTGFPGASLVNSAIGLVNGDVDPSTNAWQEFQRFFDKKVVLTITTSLKEYRSMVLTSLIVTRDASKTNGLFFVFTAREVKFVTTEGAATAVPKNAAGQAEKSAGKATNTAADGAVAKESSLLVKGLQGLKVLS